MAITGLPDADDRILLSLSDFDLFLFHSINRYTAIFCSELFWKIRFKNIFGVTLDHYIKSNDTYKNLYIILRKMKHDELQDYVLRSGYVPLILQLWDGSMRCNDTLLLAILNGRIELVKLFLKLGVDVNMYRDYPLILSVQANQPEISRILINYGADINAQNGEALRLARENNNEEMIHLLLGN